MSLPKTMWTKFRDPEYAHAYFDEFLNTYIATQIKVVREQRGYSQEKLARLAGMKQTRISLLENVNYSSWSVNTLRRIAQALGLRLKVSLETFSSGLPEVRNFGVEALQRKSLEEELAEHEQLQIQPLTDGLALAVAPTEQVRPRLSITSFVTNADHREERTPNLLPGFIYAQRGLGAGAGVGVNS